MKPNYVRRSQAASYITSRWGIPCSHGLLHKLASVGGGPEFRRAGRWPLYSEADLDSWAQSRITGPVRKASDSAESAESSFCRPLQSR
jgi:hypothetical protein